MRRLSASSVAALVAVATLAAACGDAALDVPAGAVAVPTPFELVVYAVAL